MRFLSLGSLGTILCLMVTFSISYPLKSAFGAEEGMSRQIQATQMKSSEINSNEREERSEAIGRNTAATASVLDTERQEASDAMKSQQQQLAVGQQGIDTMLQELQAAQGDLKKPTDPDVQTTTTSNLLDVGSMSQPLITEQSEIDRIKDSFNGAVKDLEGKDKLGNFEINDLMSNYNQAETLASSVRQKLDKTQSDVIAKIDPPSPGIDPGQSAQRVDLLDEEPPSSIAQKIVLEGASEAVDPEDDAAPADEPQDTVEPESLEETFQEPDFAEETFQEPDFAEETFQEPDPITDMQESTWDISPDPAAEQPV